ncbi:MAG: outer membrane lipoprotein chaperone LolA [Acidobacteria bacterium]|nr:outer membrane lipoprotein chaperone LolA [Acidobacteriota bacterium]MBI3655592.1 outer membrane lipoprotein chaperone LolA [Acidobacteriota bacterium]
MTTNSCINQPTRHSGRAGKRRRFFIVLIFVGLFFWVTLPLQAAADAPAPKLEDIIDRVQRKYEAIDRFSANFLQIYTSNVNSVRREESGILYMKKPGKMRWEYQKPESKLFVSDGKKSFFYVPSDRQVTERKYSPDDRESVPFLFLFGQGDLRREFIVSWEIIEPKRRGENYLVRLRPKLDNRAFIAVLVEIVPADYSIERMVVIDSMEDHSEFILSHFDSAAKFDDKLFEFKVPKGVDVLNVDAH